MSLPSSKAPPAQLSIRSFFQAKSPKYAPPPPSSRDTPASSSRPPLPPPPSASPPAAPAPGPPPQHQSPAAAAAAPPQPCVDAPLPPPPANLPREACVRLMSDADAVALRRINALLLPVSYPDSFYQRAVCPSESGRFSRVITWAHDADEPKVVGGVVCRVEPAGDSAPAAPHNLYIQSLCLLSPYRGMGLISAALENVIATAVSDPNLDVRTVTAHVWTENDEGLHWYNGRGFKRQELPIPGYYLKLRPDSAWLVQRLVGASVRGSLPLPPSASPAPPRPALGTTAAVMNLESASTSPGGPPPSKSGTSTPSLASSMGQSFQNQRPDTEWNDLPTDMAPGLLAPPRRIDSEPTSGASSRSSSTARKKRDRSYPAAAFGN
ncbi:GCN5-related N acetyltransferase [Hirsutella rhossiliensis]|uniref:GCN5-related N acetyltransferase n=1 Tax=Hirsutella rhossiliensis TaxID=111463 RepID=A0A9P8MZ98_9HYPO|nr:GCN5-related N acetyltransferase [Hirsutella rhossiliensis]KAH0964030.1 GCN5-related N acetyltransferase [Hirsutella rhossiliensis]